jgi:hypothetical protein
MIPSKMFDDNLRKLSLGKLMLNQEGIVPEKLLPPRSRVVRFLHFLRPRGKVPLKWLLARIRYLRLS